MAHYEYQCSDCKHVWEISEHIDEHSKPHEVRCPRCDSATVEQVMTAFFAKTGRKT